MCNFFLGYFFARSVAGERAARTAVLIVILGIVILVISTVGNPTLALFRDSFMKGWRDGQRSWNRTTRDKHTACPQDQNASSRNELSTSLR
jgi:hypothetical protein